MLDGSVMEYGKWDNFRRVLWSKCGTLRLWNMGKWDNIRHGLWSKCGTIRLRNMGKWDYNRRGLWSKCGTMRLWNIKKWDKEKWNIYLLYTAIENRIKNMIKNPAMACEWNRI